MTSDEFTNTHAEGMSLGGLYPVADEDEDNKGSGSGDIKHKKINFSGTSTSETSRLVIFSVFTGYSEHILGAPCSMVLF